MTVDELVSRLMQVSHNGFGGKEVRDTDGHPIIGVSEPDEDLSNIDETVHIEAEF